MLTKTLTSLALVGLFAGVAQAADNPLHPSYQHYPTAGINQAVQASVVQEVRNPLHPTFYVVRSTVEDKAVESSTSWAAFESNPLHPAFKRS